MAGSGTNEGISSQEQCSQQPTLHLLSAKGKPWAGEDGEGTWSTFLWSLPTVHINMSGSFLKSPTACNPTSQSRGLEGSTSQVLLTCFLYFQVTLSPHPPGVPTSALDTRLQLADLKNAQLSTCTDRM